MLDEIRLARPDDFDALWEFYVDVCEQMAHDRYSPGWTLGVYPAQPDVREAIDAGTMWLGMLDGKIAVAMEIVPHDDEEYASVPWPSGAAVDEVATIHLLAVHPRARGKHAGSEMVRKAICVARDEGKRAIHLDVMPGNIAASRIYLDEGFEFVCVQEIFYEDTGTIPFEMYELVL